MDQAQSCGGIAQPGFDTQRRGIAVRRAAKAPFGKEYHRKGWITAKIDIDRFQRQLELRVKGSKPGGVPAACYKDALDMLNAEINTQTRKSFRDKKG